MIRNKDKKVSILEPEIRSPLIGTASGGHRFSAISSVSRDTRGKKIILNIFINLLYIDQKN